jgi:hypothetical protein
MLGLKNGFRRGEREVLLFAWLAPAVMQPVHMLISVQLGFPAVLLLLMAAVRRAASTPRLAGVAVTAPPQSAAFR